MPVFLLFLCSLSVFYLQCSKIYLKIIVCFSLSKESKGKFFHLNSEWWTPSVQWQLLGELRRFSVILIKFKKTSSLSSRKHVICLGFVLMRNGIFLVMMHWRLLPGKWIKWTAFPVSSLAFSLFWRYLLILIDTCQKSKNWKEPGGLYEIGDRKLFKI